jgi:uncharacterized protein YjbI with pentapeptide repeats
LANQHHLDLLKQDKKAWNEWRRKHPSIQPNFSGADLNGANLSQTNLSRAKLIAADLSRANLNEAKLIAADLSRANLNDSYLM